MPLNIWSAPHYSNVLSSVKSQKLCNDVPISESDKVKLTVILVHYK